MHPKVSISVFYGNRLCQPTRNDAADQGFHPGPDGVLAAADEACVVRAGAVELGIGDAGVGRPREGGRIDRMDDVVDGDDAVVVVGVDVLTGDLVGEPGEMLSSGFLKLDWFCPGKIWIVIEHLI